MTSNCFLFYLCAKILTSNQQRATSNGFFIPQSALHCVECRAALNPTVVHGDAANPQLKSVVPITSSQQYSRPKQIPMNDIPVTNTKPSGASAFRAFESRVIDLLRISQFGFRISGCLVLLALSCGLASAAELKFTNADESRAEFERSVQPFLVKHCVKCHGAKEPEEN